MALDKRQREMVASLVDHPGWRVLESHVMREMDHRTVELLESDLTNMARCSTLQGEVRGMRAILNWALAVKTAYNKQLDREE